MSIKIPPLAKIEIGPPIQYPLGLPKVKFWYPSIFLEGGRHYIFSICFNRQPSLGVFLLFQTQERSVAGKG